VLPYSGEGGIFRVQHLNCPVTACAAAPGFFLQSSTATITASIFDSKNLPGSTRAVRVAREHH
jgi:hypothetical protein